MWPAPACHQSSQETHSEESDANVRGRTLCYINIIMNDAKHATIDMPPSTPTWSPPQDPPPPYGFAMDPQGQQDPPPAYVQRQQYYPPTAYVQQEQQVVIVPRSTAHGLYGAGVSRTVRGTVATVGQPENSPTPVTYYTATTVTVGRYARFKELPLCNKIVVILVFTIFLSAFIGIVCGGILGIRSHMKFKEEWDRRHDNGWF